MDEVRYGDLTVTPAVRYEDSEISGEFDDGTDVTYDHKTVVGGLSLRYDLGAGVAVFGSGAYTEVLPILDDLENPVFADTAETSRTWELGTSWERIGFRGGNDEVALKANLYRTDLRDVTSYFGVSEVEIDGLELEASYATDAGYYLDLNANVTDAEELGSDGVIAAWANAPQDTVRATLGRDFDEVLDLSWEAVFAASDDRGELEPVESYTVHARRATYAPRRWLLEGTEVRLGLENAFDTDATPSLSTRSIPEGL